MKQFRVLVAVTLALVSVTQAIAEDAVGDWGGLLAGSIRVVVHIKKGADGKLSATLDSPDQNGFGIPIDSVSATPDHLTFQLMKYNSVFDGRWDKGQHGWVGTWTQGQVLPLVLTRLAGGSSAAPVRKRPQESAIASGTLPYTNKDVLFTNRVAPSVSLSGTLSIPKGHGPFRAVVLVAGSGPNTRDEAILDHKVFLVLGDSLARRGVEVLRYDKRGIGQSTGSYKTATTRDFTSDADAAMKYLESRPEVNPKRVGLIGHSEGGIIVPAVAAEDPSVAFIVMLAGPGITGAELLPEQAALISAASGEATAKVAETKSFELKLYAAMVAAADPTEAKSKATSMIDVLVTKKILTQAVADSILDQITSPWFEYFLAYDPVPTLEKVLVPVLALNGSLDLQVPPADDLPAIRRALKQDHDVTILELDGLNHLFQDAKTGSPSEYGTIEETFSPKALKLIGDWVLKH